MNSTTLPVLSVDNSTGGQEENGEWNGLMGMLLKKKIDIIVSELSMTKERADILDFSHPLIKSRYNIYVRQHGKNLEWTAVLKPFASGVWLSIGLWIIVGSLTLSLAYYSSVLLGSESNRIFGPSETFFFILQSLCQQGQI